ncbi:lysylphosphatidylglycerol synthase transmembrane domain-containing protein [Pseudoxanthomonas mexicana]|uniref:lysylphosphatidylglycerol synthase transmembrane domain-containing protein n=1 Tax=Pseudoxanthomonas mexicana TaxID=128785 RepID=UPI00398B2829
MRRPRGRWRPRVARALTVAISLVVLLLLARYARSLDWPAVGEALRGYGAGTLVCALALAAASYLLYCAYELLSRRYGGHGLPAARTAAIGFVSYAFSLNLGALIGGGGLRLRLYTRNGVKAVEVARVALFAVATNWLGYLALAGGVLASGAMPLPARFGSSAGLQALGVAMLLAVAAYLGACARWSGRGLSLRGHAWTLPSLRMALLQLLLSSLNWLAIAGILFLLLPGEVGYPRVLGVVLVAAVLGALMHVPAGLGAWEAAFLAMLGGQLGKPAVVAALLAYRAIYYLLPLLAALALYALLEARRRRRGAATVSSSRPVQHRRHAGWREDAMNGISGRQDPLRPDAAPGPGEQPGKRDSERRNDPEQQAGAREGKREGAAAARRGPRRESPP